MRILRKNGRRCRGRGQRSRINGSFGCLLFGFLIKLRLVKNKFFFGWGWLFIFCALLPSTDARALSSLYVGGIVGVEGYLGNSIDSPADGFAYGANLGLRVTKNFELLGTLVTSNHNTASQNNLKLAYPMLSLQVHPFELAELDFSFGVGGGYFLQTENGNTDGKFGVEVNTTIDYVMQKVFLIGLEGRVNRVFSPAIGGSFYSVILRVGCIIDLEFDRPERIYIR
jgi:hypothetical protein